MNNDFQDRLREAGWRRPLTPVEKDELRAWIEAHPEAAPDWNAELALNEAMRELPAVPVPSNFTARVLAEAARPQLPSRSPTRLGRLLGLSWFPRLGVATVALAACIAVYHQHQVTRREQIARDLATLSDVAALSDPKVMQDFETIRRLGQTPAADEELIALLK